MQKWASKQKWSHRGYHLQEEDDVEPKYFKMFLYTNKFPQLPFCGPRKKLHRIIGLSKHYYMQFDLKLGHGICAILIIPCEFV